MLIRWWQQVLAHTTLPETALTRREHRAQETTQHGCTDAAQHAFTGGRHRQGDRVARQPLAYALPAACGGPSSCHNDGVQHTPPVECLPAGTMRQAAQPAARTKEDEGVPQLDL